MTYCVSVPRMLGCCTLACTAAPGSYTLLLPRMRPTRHVADDPEQRGATAQRERDARMDGGDIHDEKRGPKGQQQEERERSRAHRHAKGTGEIGALGSQLYCSSELQSGGGSGEEVINAPVGRGGRRVEVGLAACCLRYVLQVSRCRAAICAWTCARASANASQRRVRRSHDH